MVNCAVCVKEFVAPANNPQKMYCCRACNLRAWKQRNPEKHRQNILSDQARNAPARYAKAKASRPAPCPRPLRLAPCPKPPRQCDCGAWLMKKRTFVCDECAARMRAERKRQYKHTPVGRGLKAAYKAQRRARESIEREVFDPHEIFERDRWRCVLCGVATPKRLRGSYHDNAPELDHIIPLALGGCHTRANTQCTCRACNITKGARARGQLGLQLNGGRCETFSIRSNL